MNTSEQIFDPKWQEEQDRRYKEAKRKEGQLLTKFLETFANADGGDLQERLNELTEEEILQIQCLMKAEMDEKDFKEKEEHAEFMKIVENQLVYLKANKEAKRLLSVSEFKELPPVLTGDEFYGMEFPAENWLFEGLVERGQRVILSGPWKAGKTTTFGGMLKSQCDGDPFLGVFETFDDGDCSILYLNLEVPQRTFYNYLFNTLGIQNRNRLHVHNLLGESINVLNDVYFEQLRDYINKHKVCTLFVDPLMQFYSANENENSEAKWVTDRIDMLLNDCESLDNVFIVSHTGHVNGTGADEQNFSRPRGASKWADWADVLLSLTRTGPERYFAARGRNGEIPSSRLRLVEGAGLILDHGVSRRDVAADRTEQNVLEYVRNNPDSPTTQIKAEVQGGNDQITSALDKLVREGRILRTEDPEDRRRKLYRLAMQWS